MWLKVLRDLKLRVWQTVIPFLHVFYIVPVVHNDHPKIITWVFLPKRKYEICPSGYQYNEEYGKINMLRKAPAIKDGDFCLAERYVVYG